MDVGRFHAAASQPRVAITGQQEKLNNQRTFCEEKRTKLTLLWFGLNSDFGGNGNNSSQKLQTLQRSLVKVPRKVL